MADNRTPRLRLRAFAPGTAPQTIVADPSVRLAANTYPAKEWSISDDMMNLSDTASVTIANDGGQVEGLFSFGQRVEFEESDPDVAGGQWLRHFTGVITAIESHSDADGGSNLMLTAMDLGWCLTSCHAKPLVNIKQIRFQALLDLVIDPSWGFAPTLAGNDLNHRLKHGRQVIVQNHKPVLGAVLPFIQVEPGQSPIDLLRTYAAREGVLINMTARGGLVFFRPRYDRDPLYFARYRSATDGSHNNVIGRPTLRRSIDEVYSEVQCWSTVVIPPEIANTENPNEMYRHSTYTAVPNPLPFFRRHVISDAEAITDRLRLSRAKWTQQMGMWNSFQYNCEFPAHSQGGAFFVSDSMISVDDTINGAAGGLYVQSVQRSYTLKGGLSARLTCRLPGLLNPELTALDLGGGTRRTGAAKASR